LSYRKLEVKSNLEVFGGYLSFSSFLSSCTKIKKKERALWMVVKNIKGKGKCRETLLSD